MPFKVWPYQIKVKGLSFHINNMGEMPSDELICRRELSNPFDRKAIAVYSMNEGTAFRIGYLAKDIAQVIEEKYLPCPAKIMWKANENSLGLVIAI
jgi:hypothetical protein